MNIGFSFALGSIIYQRNAGGVQNLITNGDFETDLSDWTNSNSHWQWSAGRAYHPANATFNTLFQAVPFDAAGTYNIKFDYEVLQGQLRVQTRTAADGPTGNLTVPFTGTGSADETFTVSGTAAGIAFAREQSGEVSEFYVDNVVLTRLS